MRKRYPRQKPPPVSETVNCIECTTPFEGRPLRGVSGPGQMEYCPRCQDSISTRRVEVRKGKLVAIANHNRKGRARIPQARSAGGKKNGRRQVAAPYVKPTVRVHYEKKHGPRF